MKNFTLFYKGLYVLSLWALSAVSTAYAQDVSINILTSSATLPLSTTGSIQVDLCNTDPTNVDVPVNKLNPQISVGSNVTILGVTNLDGTPLTNFTVVSNTGQVIRLSNLVSLPNTNCLSFRVIIRGQIINTPGNVGDIAAVLDFQGSQTADNKTFNDNSTSSVAVTINPLLGPDLTSVIYVRPSPVYGSSPISVVVDVLELNSVASSGMITVKITRDNKLNLSFNSTESSVGGRQVQNSAWSFDGSNPSYYVLTTQQVIAAGDHLSFGLNGAVSPNGTIGTLNVSSVITGNGSEQKINNNTSASKMEYFHQ